jgi:hypothetical protein
MPGPHDTKPKETDMRIESLIALSAAALVLGGCDRRHQPVSAREPDLSTTASLEATDSVHTNAAAAPEAPAGGREELAALAGKELRRLDANIEELARRAEGLQAGAKTEADQALRELRRRRDGVADQIEALKRRSTESLAESRTRLASALSELKRLYESAWLRFEESDALKAEAVPGGVNPPNRQ